MTSATNKFTGQGHIFSGFLCVEINVKVCAKAVDENGSSLNVKRLNIHMIGVK